MALLDGVSPYRTWWRQRNWKTVQGHLIRTHARRTRQKASDTATTTIRYRVRKPQKLVHSLVVTRGWPISRKKQVWQIRLSYTYRFGNRKHTRVADTPPFDFDSEAAAIAFLEDRIHRATVKVRVNPRNPSEATAFLVVRTWRWVRLGLAFSGIGLIWLIVALVLGSVHSRRERTAERDKGAPGTPVTSG